MKRLRSTVLSSLAVLGLALSVVGVAGAQAVTQSYTSDTRLQTGMIVRLDDTDHGKVVPVTDSRATDATGIVVSPNDAPIALSGDGSKQQAYVANNGSYKVLVSDQNGPIAANDYIAVSSLAGVGMKADNLPAIVIGKAVDGFSGTQDVAGTTSVTDSSGKQRTVRLGYVTVGITITRNPLQRSTTANLPGFLQKASEAIANKPVNYVRVYLSLGVLLVTTVIVGSLLYGAVRTSMISLGRNPLARSAIYRSLLRVVLISLIVLCAGLGAVYLLLRI